MLGSWELLQSPRLIIYDTRYMPPLSSRPGPCPPRSPSTKLPGLSGCFPCPLLPLSPPIDNHSRNPPPSRRALVQVPLSAYNGVTVDNWTFEQNWCILSSTLANEECSVSRQMVNFSQWQGTKSLLQSNVEARFARARTQYLVLQDNGPAPAVLRDRTELQMPDDD